MKTYLVEAYSDEIEFKKDSLIVALTPEVCYELDKKGVKYSIIEDYYDAAELYNQVEECRRFVFRWIDDLDEFLLNNVKGLDIKLGTIYRWYLKGMVLDPLYIRCYTLEHLFQTIKPNDVIYTANTPDEPQLSYRFEHFGRSLYSQIIPVLCAKHNIPLKTILLESRKRQATEIKPSHQKEPLANRIKKRLYGSETLKKLYFIFRYIKKITYLKSAGKKKLNIFLVRVSHIGEGFIAEALVRSHQVYLLSGETILKYCWFGTKKYLKVPSETGAFKNSEWENAANFLEGHELINRISEKCKMDISEIVLPRLKFFLTKVCPKLLSLMQEFSEFYKKAKIGILFTPTVSYIQDYAALAAARSCPQIETACLVHGDAVYDSRTWNITELQNYDIHISSNSETKEYFKELSKEINSDAKLYSSCHRFSKIRKIAESRKKKGDKTIIKNRVIYLPTLMMWDAKRMDGALFFDTWYYQFQKSLIEHFASRKDYFFVWKGMPQSEEIYNPIPDFIKDNGFSNIEIATNPFVEHLVTAGRVIQDCPSTGFYESVVAGVPTISLYHESLIVRQTAASYFKKLLKPFRDTAEAIKYIDEFLNNDAELYTMTIDMEENRVIDIIEENGEVEN